MKYNRRRRYKKYKKRLGPAMVKAVKSVCQKQILKNAEMKVYSINTTAGNTVVLGAGTFFSCLDIAQGTTEITRIGNEINLHSITFRLELLHGRWQAVGYPGQNNILWRVIVFQYKQDDTVGPTDGELMKQSTANPLGTAQYCPLATRNQDYFNIYHILYDKCHMTAQQTDAGNLGTYSLYETAKYLDIRVPMKHVKRKIQYSTNTAPVYKVNNIIICFYNDADPAQFFNATYYPKVRLNETVVFTDS